MPLEWSHALHTLSSMFMRLALHDREPCDIRVSSVWVNAEVHAWRRPLARASSYAWSVGLSGDWGLGEQCLVRGDGK